MRSQIIIYGRPILQRCIDKEARTAGFDICEIFGDVKGSPYSEEGSTMAMLLKNHPLSERVVYCK